jgi:N-acyl-D-amino-acid deacylase
MRVQARLGRQSLLIGFFVLLAASTLNIPAGSATDHSERKPIKLPDVSPSFKDGTVLLPPSGPVPMTGFSPASAPYQALDKTMTGLLRKWDIPGASLTIAKNGKPIMSRGYGWADLRNKQEVQPDSLFRIASISKAITSVAVAKLIEQKKISLDDCAFEILKYPWPAGSRRDPRLNDITIADLLQCTAGWDRSRSGDPLFGQFLREAADKYSCSMRPSADAVVRLWMERSLDSLPGTHFAYSNLCYTVLGRIIARVTGHDYEEYVKSEILAPMGITRMRVGRSYVLAPGEVLHYPLPGSSESIGIFPNFTEPVPSCYGGSFSMETMSADTGWLASSSDLTKFIATMFGETGTRPISKESFDELLVWPKNIPEWKDPNVITYFAKGWQVVPQNKKHLRVVYREGCLPGSISVMMHRDDGISWAFVLNARPDDFRECQIEITKAIWQCVNAQPVR